MILWQKQATSQWLVAKESSLQEIAPSDLAIISRPGKMRSLLQVICHDHAKAVNLVHRFGGVARPLPRNWAGIGWTQKAHRPIRIGRRLEIIGEPASAGRASNMSRLIIPAAGAFGTGEHATTAMSLRLLEEISRKIQPGWQLFDAGTGTGILALAARRLGAREVLGVDIDGRAVAHARQNAQLNHVLRAHFTAADLVRWKTSARYEVVTANLFSELLIAMLPAFRRALRAKGYLIASGILREQVDSVARALRRNRFQLEKQRRRGKWIALLASKEPGPRPRRRSRRSESKRKARSRIRLADKFTTN